MIQYSVKLGVYSKVHSAEDINKILNLNYDQCWVMGMPRSARSSIMKFAQHAWFIVSDTSNQVSLDVQIKNIFDKIKPSIDKFKQLHKESEIYFNCVIEGDENPEMNFPKEVIQLINSIQASLDVDMFIAK